VELSNQLAQQIANTSVANLGCHSVSESKKFGLFALERK
jgi:hypothetical protein